MKEYTGLEIVKMLQTKELKEGNIIKDELGNEYKVFISNSETYNYIREVLSKKEPNCSLFLDDETRFTIAQQPVTFKGALESGKFVRLIDIYKFGKSGKIPHYKINDIYDKYYNKEYIPINEMITIIGISYGDIKDIFTKPVWLIED